MCFTMSLYDDSFFSLEEFIGKISKKIHFFDVVRIRDDRKGGVSPS